MCEDVNTEDLGKVGDLEGPDWNSFGHQEEVGGLMFGGDNVGDETTGYPLQYQQHSSLISQAAAGIQKLCTMSKLTNNVHE
jgi:hypothetical protein